MKSRDWKSQPREEQKKEDPGARKGRKAAKHCVFPMICGSGGSKSRLAKAAGAEPAGQMRDEQLHAVVARSTFRSQNVKNTTCSGYFWKLRCRKSARRCGAKHISKSTRTKHTRPGPLLEVEMSKKCKPLLREAHFEVKMLKTPHVGTAFGGSDVVSRGRRKGLCTLSKVSKTRGFGSISKKDSRRGTFEEDLQFRGRCSTRDMFIRAVRRSGHWFPEKGCILEHQIFSFGKMILRDRCSTSYDLASVFRGRHSPLDRW